MLQKTDRFDISDKRRQKGKRNEKQRMENKDAAAHSSRNGGGDGGRFERLFRWQFGERFPYPIYTGPERSTVE
ncbi:MAG: hypothetical protein OHK0029_20720 [Armatimonadaceae bacterium]